MIDTLQKNVVLDYGYIYLLLYRKWGAIYSYTFLVYITLVNAVEVKHNPYSLLVSVGDLKAKSAAKGPKEA